MKKVTAMLFSMAVGLNAVSMAAKAKASEEQETDVLLIGGGIMSATLGTYLRELEPSGAELPWMDNNRSGSCALAAAARSAGFAVLP